MPSYGEAIPVGSSVSITLGAVTQTATVDASGNFTATFDTSTLDVASSPYAVTYSFAGNASFTGAADGSSTLTVTQAPSTTTVADAGGTYDGVTQFAATPTVSGVGVIIGSATLEYFDLDTNTSLGSTAPTGAGNYTVTATYAGDANHTGSTSGPVSFTVAKAVSTTTTFGAGPFVADGTTQTGGSGTVTGAGGLATVATSLTYSGDQVNPGIYYVTAHYAGDANHEASDGQAVAITIVPPNEAPTLTNLTNSSPAGQAFMGADAVTIAALFSDPDLLDTHTVLINWGDGTTTAGSVNEVLHKIAGSHVYASGGVYTITVTLSDHAGATSVLTTTATVAGIGLRNGVLSIIGTAGRDIINVSQYGSTICVYGRFDVEDRDDDDDFDCDDYRGRWDRDRYHRTYSLTFNAASVSAIRIDGKGCDDRIYVGTSVTPPTSIDGGAGDDLVWACARSNSVTDLLGDNWIWTGRGGNTIIVGDGDNRIWTDGGADFITAGQGDNEIHLGGDNDTVSAGNGNNRIWGGSGNDSITVGNGSNRIDFGSGDDTIVTGNGNSTIDAGSGDDTIRTGSGRDCIDAGSGNDFVNAGAGKDTIDGGSGNDLLLGGDGDDTLAGGAGKDFLLGGDGKDTLYGDSGNDILLGGYVLGLTDAQLATLLSSWARASSYSSAVVAVTGSSGTKLITDGANQNVFSDVFADKLSGDSGQDLFLADTKLDETGAIKDQLTDASNNETSLDIDKA